MKQHPFAENRAHYQARANTRDYPRMRISFSQANSFRRGTSRQRVQVRTSSSHDPPSSPNRLLLMQPTEVSFFTITPLVRWMLIQPKQPSCYVNIGNTTYRTAVAVPLVVR